MICAYDSYPNRGECSATVVGSILVWSCVEELTERFPIIHINISFKSERSGKDVGDVGGGGEVGRIDSIMINDERNELFI